MTSVSRFDFGDVVLVPFPFTDQSGAKKRPAVVVSIAGYNTNRKDIVIMAITSHVLKPVFSTIEQGLVMRVIGHLSAADLQSLQRLLEKVTG